MLQEKSATMARHRSFTPDFKARLAIEAITSVKTAAEICREHGINPQLVFRRKAELLGNAAGMSFRVIPS